MELHRGVDQVKGVENKIQVSRNGKLGLTIFIAQCPKIRLLQVSHVPQLCRRMLRVLQALFDLDSFVGFDCFTQNHDVCDGRIEGLVTATFVIVDILAHHSPVLQLENFLTENSVGVDQAVENESGWQSLTVSGIPTDPEKGALLTRVLRLSRLDIKD